MSVRYIAAPHRGPSATRNAGVEQAVAPVILFMDDDCEADHALVATHAAETTAPGTVTIGRVVWHPDLTVTPFMELVTRGAQFNFGAITDPDAAPFSCFYTSNVSVTRADLAAVGGFDEGLPLYGEDTELGYRLSRIMGCGCATGPKPSSTIISRWSCVPTCSGSGVPVALRCSSWRATRSCVAPWI